MVKVIFKIFLILILVILQVSIFEKLSFFEVIPNIILALAVSLLFLGFFNDALLVGGIGGLFFDLTSRFYFGINTLFFICVLLVIQFYVLKVFPTPKTYTSFFVFLIIFLSYEVTIFVIQKTFPGWQLIVSATINSLWAIIFYYIVKKLLYYQDETVIFPK